MPSKGKNKTESGPPVLMVEDCHDSLRSYTGAWSCHSTETLVFLKQGLLPSYSESHRRRRISEQQNGDSCRKQFRITQELRGLLSCPRRPSWSPCRAWPSPHLAALRSPIPPAR